MTRGCSLEQDLRLLINNSKYSNIDILCKDEKKLHGCRAILAARSEVFDALLYNGMRESYEKQISFPTISSFGMKIILEYIYTGMIKEESLTKDNIVEAYNAANYFQLPDLQDFITKTVANTLEKNYQDNYSPELLTKVVDTMEHTEDNALFDLLINAVAKIPLNTIDFSRLSISALQHLLSFSHEKKIPFVTSEYEVFRYSTILASSRVSSDATKALLERLPTLEKLDDFRQINNEPILDHQKVAKELESLTKFIDFRRIKAQTLANIIEPLKIIPVEIILNVYRHKAISINSDLNEIRGVPLYTYIDSDFLWDELACGTNLIIEDNGKVVGEQNDRKSQKSVRTKIALENKGIFEWDVFIEKYCEYSWIGVCASENFDCERYAGHQNSGWVLGSSGYCR